MLKWLQAQMEQRAHAENTEGKNNEMFNRLYTETTTGKTNEMSNRMYA